MEDTPCDPDDPELLGAIGVIEWLLQRMGSAEPIRSSEYDAYAGTISYAYNLPVVSPRTWARYLTYLLGPSRPRRIAGEVVRVRDLGPELVAAIVARGDGHAQEL